MGTDSKPSKYVGPTEVVNRRGHVYLYDSGSGELFAELTPEAAAAVRALHSGTVTLAYTAPDRHPLADRGMRIDLGVVAEAMP